MNSPPPAPAGGTESNGVASSSPTPAAVPAELRAQYEDLAARAATLGRALRPVPIVEIATSSTEDNHFWPGSIHGTRPPRIRLSQDLPSMPAHDRGFSMAHELSHALSFQEKARRLQIQDRIFLIGIAVAVLAGVAEAALHISRVGIPVVSVALGLLAFASLGVTILITLAVTRREEAATDVMAATVFGEALTEAGMRRLERREGASLQRRWRWFRTHPLPPTRRASGLDLTAARYAENSNRRESLDQSD